MKTDIEGAVRVFTAAHRHVDLVEAVVDTTGSRPYLNLWAWNIHQGKRFKDAMREVAATRNWGFLADIVNEGGSSTFIIALESMYPDWPDALDEGDKRMIRVLQAAASALPESTAFIFHHVAAWPPVDIRTGKAIDL
ncbi:hypothetical protein [Chitinolyticbacter albus]|uniref:hypothetical protein n=1 Tax=Chitinolyticbacter albus TaxID=2961951 RepID=UPI00210A5718|nr:hypothetical protein [Chitinolyticbacter albus]